MTATHFRWPAIAASLLITIGIGWYLFGYIKPKLSQTGYDHALALFSACNRRDAVRIQQIDRLINDNIAAEALQDSDAVWLRKIIRHADRGDWKVASSQLRRILNQQVEGATPSPVRD